MSQLKINSTDTDEQKATTILNPDDDNDVDITMTPTGRNNSNNNNQNISTVTDRSINSTNSSNSDNSNNSIKSNVVQQQQQHLPNDHNGNDSNPKTITVPNKPAVPSQILLTKEQIEALQARVIKHRNRIYKEHERIKGHGHRQQFTITDSNYLWCSAVSQMRLKSWISKCLQWVDQNQSKMTPVNWTGKELPPRAIFTSDAFIGSKDIEAWLEFISEIMSQDSTFQLYHMKIDQMSISHPVGKEIHVQFDEKSDFEQNVAEFQVLQDSLNLVDTIEINKSLVSVRFHERMTVYDKFKATILNHHPDIKDSQRCEEVYAKKIKQRYRNIFCKKFAMNVLAGNGDLNNIIDNINFGNYYKEIDPNAPIDVSLYRLNVKDDIIMSPKINATYIQQWAQAFINRPKNILVPLKLPPWVSSKKMEALLNEMFPNGFIKHYQRRYADAADGNDPNFKSASNKDKSPPLSFELSCNPHLILKKGDDHQPEFFVAGRMVKFVPYKADIIDDWIDHGWTRCNGCRTWGQYTSDCSICRESKNTARNDLKRRLQRDKIPSSEIISRVGKVRSIRSCYRCSRNVTKDHNSRTCVEPTYCKKCQLNHPLSDREKCEVLKSGEGFFRNVVYMAEHGIDASQFSVFVTLNYIRGTPFPEPSIPKNLQVNYHPNKPQNQRSPNKHRNRHRNQHQYNSNKNVKKSNANPKHNHHRKQPPLPPIHPNKSNTNNNRSRNSIDLTQSPLTHNKVNDDDLYTFTDDEDNTPSINLPKLSELPSKGNKIPTKTILLNAGQNVSNFNTPKMLRFPTMNGNDPSSVSIPSNINMNIINNVSKKNDDHQPMNVERNSRRNRQNDKTNDVSRSRSRNNPNHPQKPQPKSQQNRNRSRKNENDSD